MLDQLPGASGSPKTLSRAERQAQYYGSSASAYDATHIRSGDEHEVALRYMTALMKAHGLRTILDVGTGTGRVIPPLQASGFDVVGIEPVKALLDKAAEKSLAGTVLVLGRGDNLPFPDQSFDAVCEFGVLHHVERPQDVVAEMLRVARSAIFLSDTNRFGRSSVFSRLSKLLLWKCGLWRAAYRVRKGGKNCDISECDGIAYSYSVYDSFDQIDRWASSVFAIPTKVEGPKRSSWFSPLLTSSHALLCGIRKQC